jgi:hypothetical protein
MPVKKQIRKRLSNLKFLRGYLTFMKKVSDNNCQKVCEQKMMSLEEDIQFLERPILNNRN